jgi:hypothetical protein
MLHVAQMACGYAVDIIPHDMTDRPPAAGRFDLNQLPRDNLGAFFIA